MNKTLLVILSSLLVLCISLIFIYYLINFIVDMFEDYNTNVFNYPLPYLLIASILFMSYRLFNQNKNENK